MTTAAVPLRATPRERVLAQPAIDGLFLATILFVTFAKIHWELAADLSLADVLTAGFLVCFLWDRFERGDGRLTRTSIVGLAARAQGRGALCCALVDWSDRAGRKSSDTRGHGRAPTATTNDARWQVGR